MISDDEEVLKFKTPYLIQRMEIISKDSEVRFGRRFLNEYMGSAEFEWNAMAARLRELNANSRVGQVVIEDPAGYKLAVVVYNPDNYNLDGVQHVLNGLWNSKFRTKEWTNFDAPSRAPTRYGRENYALKTKAWFDITNGLFWTLENINPRDVQSNIKLSVEYMDGLREDDRVVVKEQPKPIISPERQRLIDAGIIKPSK